MIMIVAGVWLVGDLASAFRISKPAVYKLPWDDSQVNNLNDTLDKLFQLVQGEFSLDIVETSKTRSDNGDFWLISTGLQTRLQFKAQDRIWTVDAY